MTSRKTDPEQEPNDGFTVLRCEAGRVLTKTWKLGASGQPERLDFEAGAYFTIEEVAFRGLRGASRELARAAADPRACIIRGRPIPGIDLSRPRRRLKRARPGEQDGEAVFEGVARRLLCADIDDLEMPEGVDPCVDGEEAARALVRRYLPPEFQGVTFAWQWSSSQGFRPGQANAHLFFFLSRALTGEEIKRWSRAMGLTGVFCPSVLGDVQPIYTAPPIFEGLVDPLPRRAGQWIGDHDEVHLDIPGSAEGSTGPSGHPGAPGGTGRPITDELLERVAEELLDAWPAYGGGAHTGLLPLAGGLLRLGWSQELAIDLLVRVHGRRPGDPTEIDRAVRDTAGAIKNGKATGWKELGEHLGRDVVGRVLDLLRDRRREAPLPPDPRPPEDEPPPPDDPEGRPAPKRTYQPTDLGNAERLVDSHGPDLRFCYARNAWASWGGQRWTWTPGEVDRRASRVAKAMHEEAWARYHTMNPDGGDAHKDPAIKYSLVTQNHARRVAMVETARQMLPVDADAFDADPWLLNTPDGIVDLRTGQLGPHRREAMLSRMTNHGPGPSQAGGWQAFLNRIFGDDEELMGFVRRAVGHSITGMTGEQCLFLLIGTGANGKSTFLNVLGRVLGSYAGTAAFKVLLHDAHGHSKDPELCELDGPRLVTALEPNPAAPFDESVIKGLTGCDPITAARKYEAPITFRPVLKLWLATNSAPRMQHGGIAMRRRLRVIPFDVSIPPEEQNPRLEAELLAEAPGILRWAIDGCLEWQRTGLRPPQSVLDAVEKYIDTSDPLSDWLGDCTTSGPGLRELLALVHSNYVAFSEAAGVGHPYTRQGLAGALRSRGFECKKSHGSRWVVGMQLGKTGASGDPRGTPSHLTAKFSNPKLLGVGSPGGTPVLFDASGDDIP